MKKLLLLLFIIPYIIHAQVQIVTLDGSKSIDTDGQIVKYKWTVVSAAAPVSIQNDTLVKTTVVPQNGAQWTPGTYIFQLAVTDNLGATSSAQTKVTWTAPLPTVNAGNDQTINLPTNTITLHASAIASLGKIKTWLWSQVSGANTPTFNRKDTSVITISGLVASVYTFQITGTDNFGQTATDQVNVIVKAANVAPSANAGADQNLSFPVSSVTIGGLDKPSGLAVRWTRKSGFWSVINSPTSSITTVKIYFPGTYVYTKTVTDAQGRKASDDVTVIVKR